MILPFLAGTKLIKATSRLTVCVSGGGAGVDKVWEQDSAETWKMLVNRADSQLSAARGF